MPTRPGRTKLRSRFSRLALRQAINGPMPTSVSSSKAHGMLTRLKIGGPIVTLRPVASSDNSGNVVKNSTVIAIPTRIRLLNRNDDSRDRSDSRRCSVRRLSRRDTRSRSEPKNTRARNTPNAGPMSDVANECTDDRMPLRVRNVPKIDSENVRITSSAFHTLSMPLRSWIITECRNAVPVSQGMSDAFSTGSQAQ